MRYSSRRDVNVSFAVHEKNESLLLSFSWANVSIHYRLVKLTYVLTCEYPPRVASEIQPAFFFLLVPNEMIYIRY